MLSIHQPSYFPWLGLLNKIDQCDLFMVMDEVQLSDSAYQHRNLFLTTDGRAKYLSIPFVRKNYLQKRFRDIEIASDDWRERHLSFIKNSYAKHPHAAEVMPHLERYYATQYGSLFEAVMASMELSFALFGIETKVVLQSEMSYDRSLRRGALVVALARAAGARCYLSGEGARAYLDESAFGTELALRYSSFNHPRYPQHGRTDFYPGLAAIDALFNLGISGARTLLVREEIEAS